MTSTHEAQQLLRAGRLVEAESAFKALLEASPDNVEALNATALFAIRDGNASRALALLERAARIAPHDAATLHHMGLACEAVGDLVASVKAHAAAVELAPNLNIARLHLAKVLERQGNIESAAIQYQRALHDAQANGRWLNAASTPPAVRDLVEHAVSTVRNYSRDAFRRLWRPLVDKFGPDSLNRVEKCLRIYMNEEQPTYLDSRQQPTFLFFPDLRSAPYIDADSLPWVPELEGRTSAIRRELLQVLGSSQGSERVFTSEELEGENLRGLDTPPSWNGYYFYRHGERRVENCARCPETAIALERLPLCQIRDHGPEVLFSVFSAGTHLLPHRGITNTRLVAHLPLIVPRDCTLSVGGERHDWREGKVVVFDDTYLHEAWNRSDKVRVVMIFDIWNPQLSEVERLAVAELVAAIGDFRHAVESA